jgi:putative FmdB family regulatory protein
MPLYDFHCAKCGKTVEVLMKMTSETPVCADCGGSMEKLLSKPADPGKSAGIIAGARAQAKKEGHFSNYSKAEKRKI